MAGADAGMDLGFSRTEGSAGFEKTKFLKFVDLFFYLTNLLIFFILNRPKLFQALRGLF